MRTLFYVSILIICSSILAIQGFKWYIEPEKLDLRKGDCFSLDLQDMAYWTGFATHSLQIYDIRNLNGYDLIIFRPIKVEGGYYQNEVKDRFKEPTPSYETTGLVWAWRRDFQWMQKMQKGKWTRTMGYSRFSYGDSTRKGVTCNSLRN